MTSLCMLKERILANWGAGGTSTKEDGKRWAGKWGEGPVGSWFARMGLALLEEQETVKLLKRRNGIISEGPNEISPSWMIHQKGQLIKPQHMTTMKIK